jgi:hypothetical protein
VVEAILQGGKLVSRLDMLLSAAVLVWCFGRGNHQRGGPRWMRGRQGDGWWNYATGLDWKDIAVFGTITAIGVTAGWLGKM